MTEIRHRTVRTNGIDMHVAEAGDGPVVVFCHGFPELWFSWRYQIPVLAEAGYRVVAPDQRGYGDTSRPRAVDDYDILQLTGDLAGLLDDLGADDAIFAGHDWGAIVVWNMALLHPERVRAVVNLSVPFPSRPSVPPTQRLRERHGDRFFYQLYFQQVGPPEAEFEADVRRSLRMFYGPTNIDAFADGPPPAEGTGVLDIFLDTGEPPEWLTPEELEVYVRAFEGSGFFGPVSWYRNFDRNWELTPHLAGAKVTQPALFMAGAQDPVNLFMSRDAMREHVVNLHEEPDVPGASHWLQQERPDAVNEAFLRFLGTLG